MTNYLPLTPCPGCGCIIENIRSTKVKCPSCGCNLHALVDPETKERKLLDDEGKAKLLSRKEELKVINKAVRLFGQHGMTKKAIEDELARMKKDGQTWGYRDAVWSLVNKMVINEVGKGDFHTLQMLYYEQALFLEFEGKDPAPLLQQSNEMALRDLQRHVDRVKIFSEHGCDACRAMEGKEFSIEEALRTHPLPNPQCTHRFEEGHYPFCRCMYQAAIDLSHSS